MVYDHTGYDFQARFIVCDRTGGGKHEPKFNPSPYYNFPGTREYCALLGTNSSFRREALLNVGGFDEEYEYYLDETDLCLRLVDHGYAVKFVENAFVHHKYLESHLRDSKRALKNWFPILKNKAYFSFRHGVGYFTPDELNQTLANFAAAHREALERSISVGLNSPTDLEVLNNDVERAYVQGMKAALTRSPELIKPASLSQYRSAFKPFASLLSEEGALRLCFLCQEDPSMTGKGGIARFTWDLAKAVARKGHVVHVLTRGSEHNRIDFESGVWVHRIVPTSHATPVLPAGLSVPQALWDYSASMCDELVRLSVHRRVDLVSAPIWDVEGLAILLDGRFPLITSLQTTFAVALEMHKEWETDPQFMADFGQKIIALEKFILLNSRGINAHSRAIVSDTAHRYDLVFDENTLTVIPLGLDDQRTTVRSAGARESLNILFVGRLEQRKGIDVLLAIVPQILREFPTARFTIVGDRSLKNDRGVTYQEEFVRKRENEAFLERVDFTGIVSDDKLRHHYETCDIFVAPSRFESFGLVFLEAMMFGKPVIGCRAGGMPEVIDSPRTGLLAEPGDPVSLLNALRALLQDARYRYEAGVEARHRFERMYTSERMAEEFISMARKRVRAKA